MSQETPVSIGMQDVKLRSILIFSTVGVLASIIFGLLYLFVIAPSAPGSSIGWFLFAFGTGITMIVMPCTLPLAFVIVPLSMGKGVAKGLGIALAFGIGVAVTQSMYGVIAALIGGIAIDALGAPLESVKNWVYLIAGIFALLFALGEIGLLKVRMPTYTGAAPAFIQRRPDITKAFLLGLFLGNIGVGCPHPATPLMLIEVATSGDVLYGWLMFLTHAIGRILPLLLLAFLGILGVNGLNWLMTRKEAVERATGWAMVFVAGFILTLGLFTHDWWVNSGIHSALEKVTNESYFNERFNDMLNTAVAHVHGLEEGPGMFGLPLWLGNWFLVAVWLIPMWWWWSKKRRSLLTSPAFRLQAIEERILRLTESHTNLKNVVPLTEATHDSALSEYQTQLEALEKLRKEAEQQVQSAAQSQLKEPLARTYETRILGIQRNYLIILSIFLPLTFIYFLPTNFYLTSVSGLGDHHQDDEHGAAVEDDGHMHDHGAAAAPSSMKRSESTEGLSDATKYEIVSLADGDHYAMTASYVKKQVGNRTLRMMAYNGSVPGPFIYAPEGATIYIDFTNNTDIDQTIHSHGVRLDNTDDGVPGMTQAEVKPGEKYTYAVTFRDAGVTWYHPHTRDDIGQELGLYGNYIVDPTDPDYWNPVNRDIPLVIDDILLDADGTVGDFYDDRITHALLGRFGNTFLVNGEENYVLPAKKGEVVRFYVTNVSNARTYNLSIPGAKIKVVGADIGRYEREYFADNVLISPAERVVVEVLFENEGTYRLTNTTPNGSVDLASFAVSDEPVTTSLRESFMFARTNTEVVNEFATFRDRAYQPSDKKLTLTIDPKSAMTLDHSAHAHGDTTQDQSHTDHGDTMMHDGMEMSGMMGKVGESAIQWDDETNSDAVNSDKNIVWRLIDEETGKSNMDIPISDWTWKNGSLVKISLTNTAMAMHTMQHPIHLHGQRFVELSRNGVVNKNMAWKDTVLVLPGETVDILVDMSNPGDWMLHCHIVEHIFAGMMLAFRVEAADGTAPGDEWREQYGMSHLHSDTPTTAEATKDSQYKYETLIDSKGYSVVSDKTSFSKGKLEYTELSFKKPNGTALNLSSEDDALRIWFVRSDGFSFMTYPGNTDFLQNAPKTGSQAMPMHDDGHDHLHVLPFVKTAHAHGDEEDGHDDTHEDMHHDMHADSVRTYSVPVVFPDGGTYRAFVEFIPEGSTKTVVASFEVVVKDGSFTVDSLGWTPTEKWWSLLIASFLIMFPLVYGVRRYINAPIN